MTRSTKKIFLIAPNFHFLLLIRQSCCCHPFNPSFPCMIIFPLFSPLNLFIYKTVEARAPSQAAQFCWQIRWFMARFYCNDKLGCLVRWAHQMKVFWCIVWPVSLVICFQCVRSVSQELSETILTMVANCSNVMNKARQPPPGVMPKGRAPSTSSLDAISPVRVCWVRISALCWVFFENVVFAAMMAEWILHCVMQVDPLTAMGSLNLGGSATTHTQNMQGFTTPLSSAFSNPQSPAKAFPPLTNPNPSTAFGGISSLSSQLPGTT